MIKKTIPSPTAPKALRIAVSVKTAAMMMEVSEKSIRRLIERGLLKPNRALRVHRIPISQIEELLASHG